MTNKSIVDQIVSNYGTGNEATQVITGTTYSFTFSGIRDYLGDNPPVVFDATTPVTVTYTTGNPSITPDGEVTIADGATPTVAELLEFCVELNAKIDAILEAFQG